MTGNEKIVPGCSAPPDPIIAARETFARELDRVAVDPGFPGLVRVGRFALGQSDNRGYPLCVPLLGEGHLAIAGSSDGDFATRREQRVAAGIALTAVTATVARLPKGAAHVTVYNPEGALKDSFSMFAELNKQDVGERYKNIRVGRLPELFGRLQDDIDACEANPDVLRAFDSYRKLVESGAEPSIPWRIVVLLGGMLENLSANEQKQLDDIAANGANQGIALVTAGHLRPTPGDSAHATTTLSILKNGPDWAELSLTPGIKVYVDAPPEAADVQRALTAERPPLKPGPSMSGEGYVWMINNGRKKITAVEAALKELHQKCPAEFPYLDVQFLKDQIKPSTKRYADIIAGLSTAEDPTTNSQNIALGVLDQHEHPVPILMALAAFGLALETRRASTRPASVPEGLQEQSRLQLESYLPHLVGLRKLMRDPSSVGPTVQEYFAEQLPDKPPAWMFQLMADWAFPPGEVVKELRDREVSYSVLHDLYAAFGVKYPAKDGSGIDLRKPEHAVIRNALIELHLAQLYGFEQLETPKTVRDMVVRRAKSRIDAVENVTDLPESARGLFEHMLRHSIRLKGIQLPVAA